VIGSEKVPLQMSAPMRSPGRRNKIADGDNVTVRESRAATKHKEILNVTEFRLSPGEIHYLYWHIQGAIMEPETRQSLRNAWGFCERHAWAAMLVESAFRPGFLHGPSILYEDIMSRALSAFDLSGPLLAPRLRFSLREKGPCLMCEMGYGPENEGKASREILERGGNQDHLRAFAHRTEKYWSETVCGVCNNSDSLERCRRHLIEDADRGFLPAISLQRETLSEACTTALSCMLALLFVVITALPPIKTGQPSSALSDGAADGGHCC